jgi:predicted ATP-grasp superfamily ATP-dependent carboligase
MKTVVLIGASVRAAAQSAERAGYRVIGIDLFGDRDCRAACDRFALLDESNRAAELFDEFSSADVVCVGGFADPTSVLESLGSHAGRIEKALNLQNRLKQPAFLRSIADAGGFFFPETFSSAAEKIESSVPTDGRWLVKPQRGSGGIGVTWATADTLVPDENVSIQRYVAGRLFGATLLIDPERAMVLGMCRSLFHRHGHGHQAMPFLYAGSFGPIPIEDDLARKLACIGREIHHRTGLDRTGLDRTGLDRTGLVGLCNIDFIIDRDGQPWLLEINPRWSGSSEVIERSLVGDETSLFALGRDPSLSSSIAIDPTMQTYKRVLYASRSGRPVRFKLQSIAPEIGLKLNIPGVTIADVPADGTQIEPGWPICSVLMDMTEKSDFKSIARVRSIRDRILHGGGQSASFSSANDLMR